MFRVIYNFAQVLSPLQSLSLVELLPGSPAPAVHRVHILRVHFLDEEIVCPGFSHLQQKSGGVRSKHPPKDGQ